MRLAKLETALRLVLGFNESFNRHDVSGMMEHMSEDCLFENIHPAPDGTVYKGKQAVMRFWQKFFEHSPQTQIEIEEIFGPGERCVMHWKYSRMDAQGGRVMCAAWMYTVCGMG